MLHSSDFDKNSGTVLKTAQIMTKTPPAMIKTSKGRTSKLVTKKNPGN